MDPNRRGAGPVGSVFGNPGEELNYIK